MEHHRCPACGDRGYVGNDLVCGSCGSQLFRVDQRLTTEGGGPSLVRSLGGAVLIGLVVGLLGLWARPGMAVAPPDQAPRLDVAFVIDTTGSMADEIEVVKGQVGKIMDRVQSGQPKPDVRFGLVLYRDHGDAYVTRSFQFTRDIDAIANDLQEVEADGGGDTPEAVSEALRVAVDELNWDRSQDCGRLMFLIGDAAPHQRGRGFRAELARARQLGIKLHAWGCSGILESGDSEFREMAQIGGGDFQYLTYRQQVVKADGSRSNVVFQGREAYEVKAGADWKKGAARLRRGEATKLSKSAFSAPTAYGAGRFKSPAYLSVGKEMDNNLDRVLTEQVMDEARVQGVYY